MKVKNLNQLMMKSKMTIEEFLECKTHWLKEWQDKYMVMKGLSEDEFEKLILEI